MGALRRWPSIVGDLQYRNGTARARLICKRYALPQPAVSHLERLLRLASLALRSLRSGMQAAASEAPAVLARTLVDDAHLDRLFEEIAGGKKADEYQTTGLKTGVQSLDEAFGESRLQKGRVVAVSCEQGAGGMDVGVFSTRRTFILFELTRQ